jgi:hypothetical protein
MSEDLPGEIPVIKYHFIITLQWTEGTENRVTRAETCEGVYELREPGVTRQRAFQELNDAAAKQFHIPEGAGRITLLFVLEPLMMGDPRLWSS